MKSRRTRLYAYGWVLALLASGCGSGEFLVSPNSTFPGDATTSGDGATAVDGASADAPSVDGGEAATPPGDASVDGSLLDAGGSADGSDGSLGPDGSDGALPTDGGTVPDGAACDPTKSPHDDPCVLSAAYGVFVSPGGADSNPGTAAAPKKSIAAAIALAIADNRPRVYLCDGVYPEAVDLRVGVSLFGGVGCPAGDAGPSYFTGTFAQILPGVDQVPLTIEGADASIAIEDLALTAGNAAGQDDAGNGLSSIAALVNTSTVAFRRCTFLAGGGDRGADGTTSSNYVGDTAPDGDPADGGTNGAGGSITCVDGTRSFGGNGGVSSNHGGDGGAVPLPVLTPGMNGAGGLAVLGDCVDPAEPGASGASAGVPGRATTTIGTLTASGWDPSGGGAGGNGNPGQGGGGGGQNTTLQAMPVGGFGGGAGGCGGAGGTGGGGGGGSIALASVASHVDVTGCSFVSGVGGAGGRGGDGQQGQGGGSSPDPDAGIACTGGTGGNGAGGAAGAGGAGGISVCVLWSGILPTGAISCVTGTAGAQGAGGVGGAGGMNALGAAGGGASAAAGASGVVQAELSTP